MNAQTADDTFRADLVALIPYMRAFARTLCRHAAQADDIAQDALASAWFHREAFQAGTNLKAWTFQILRNAFLSDKRKSWRWHSLDPQGEAALVAVTSPDARLELDEMRRALSMLVDNQREALILVAVAGLSYEDAARVCGSEVGTMKSRVSRARGRLAALMAEGHLDRDDIPCDQAMAAIFAQTQALKLHLAA
jgi:RNA polymerase sigma-70 factor (ECF subfamily)